MIRSAAVLPAVALLGVAALAAPAHADDAATYAAGSHVKVVAHVPGTESTVVDVPVAGLTAGAATSAVNAAEARAAKKTLTLTARPVHGKVTKFAVTEGSLLSKFPHLTLTDPATLTSAYSPTIRLGIDSAAYSKLVAKTTKAATVAPKNATIAVAPHNAIKVDKGWNGSTLDTAHLKVALVKAVGTGGGVLPETPVKAEYGAATVGTAIVVHTAANKLYLYKKGKLYRTITVATGQAGYPSPHGLFHVIEREPAPSWYNPHDPWSESLPDVIGPGPDNPLGTRALQLDSPGILIHGIPEEENATLGQNASHGCVRVERYTMEALYPLVPLDTPVLMIP